MYDKIIFIVAPLNKVLRVKVNSSYRTHCQWLKWLKFYLPPLPHDLLCFDRVVIPKFADQCKPSFRSTMSLRCVRCKRYPRQQLSLDINDSTLTHRINVEKKPLNFDPTRWRLPTLKTENLRSVTVTGKYQIAKTLRVAVGSADRGWCRLRSSVRPSTQSNRSRLAAEMDANQNPTGPLETRNAQRKCVTFCFDYCRRTLNFWCKYDKCIYY